MVTTVHASKIDGINIIVPCDVCIKNGIRRKYVYHIYGTGEDNIPNGIVSRNNHCDYDSDKEVEIIIDEYTERFNQIRKKKNVK